jgi:hypothetical protein
LTRQVQNWDAEFVFNLTDIEPLVDKIFISQRPTLFNQKYKAIYDFTLPGDLDSQRQNLLHVELSCKYTVLVRKP